MWTCQNDGTLTSSDIGGCVEHASCQPTPAGVNGCICDEGFLGNGLENCEDITDCTYTYNDEIGPITMQV